MILFHYCAENDLCKINDMLMYMDNLIIVRHSETNCSPDLYKGHSEYEVSEYGHDLIEELKRNLRAVDYGIESIYSSDLNRAKVTADGIDEVYNVGVQKDNRLREIDFGDFTGKTSDDVQEFSKSPYENPYPNGESISELNDRVRDFYDEVIKGSSGIQLVVTHTYPIYWFMTNFYGEEPMNLQMNILNCQTFKFDYPEVTTITPEYSVS